MRVLKMFLLPYLGAVIAAAFLWSIYMLARSASG